MNHTDETLGVEEVVGLMRTETATVMQFARRGELPGTRIGNSWLFLREDVMAFLRTRIATDTEARGRQTSNSILAVSVPPVRDGRRKAPPVLPSLPGSVPAKKRSS